MPFRIEDALQMEAQGMVRREIAKALGVSAANLSYHLCRLGIPAPHQPVWTQARREAVSQDRLPAAHAWQQKPCPLTLRKGEREIVARIVAAAEATGRWAGVEAAMLTIAQARGVM